MKKSKKYRNVFKCGENCKISKDAIIEKNVILGNNCTIEGKCHIFSDVEIENSTIKNSVIKTKSKIINSYITDSIISENCTIGPYTHIRNNTLIDNNCKIGNFVEIKNSKIGARTKACHLAYIGDAEIGEDCNIGCGVIFANYNGFEKFKTIVGKRVFIGCNSTIIAPCSLKDECFIAGGSTITQNIEDRELAIARNRQVNKQSFYNPYLENFKRAKIYFGTDGIRGIYGKDLTTQLAEKVGNAICQIKENVKIIIGRDTRTSGAKLKNAFIQGAIQGGATIYDVGIVPTSCISYLTKTLNLDYGIVITASHNPKEYNGIKVFGNNGIKISDSEEIKIENNLNSQIKKSNGKCLNLTKEVSIYEKFLKSATNINFQGLKVVLDCANGASKTIAPKIFKLLGASVQAINTKGEINLNCGATHIEALQQNMNGADIGFSFDGDADRVIMIDKNGNIIDGDKIIYLLALWYKKNGFEIKKVIGTILTNSKIEELLIQEDIELVRTQVGDKYIIEEMLKSGKTIGGEQAGHIIIGDKHITGDGILTSIILCSILISDPIFFEKCLKVQLYPQANEEVKTKNFKAKTVLESENIKKAILKAKNFGRVIVRPSGTEPKIRIMVESINHSKELAKQIKEEIEKVVDKMV